MEIWFWGGKGGDGVALLDEGIGAAGFADVFEHDFAGLEGGVAEAEFEEFEHAGFLVEDEFGF